MSESDREESPKIIYALTPNDESGGGVIIEHGSPKYMALYFEGVPEAEINFFGVMPEGMFVRLRFEVRRTDEKNTYIWKFTDVYLPDVGPHYSPGDIFTTHVFYRDEERRVEDNPGTFEFFLAQDGAVLRDLARKRGIVYMVHQSRSQLAMMLSAPIPQEKRCPQCGSGIGIMHGSECPVSLCLITGRVRNECNGKHDFICGRLRWNGYEPGVLESFVYSVTPQVIVSRGTWDRNERVFVYEMNEEPVREIDETYDSSPELKSEDQAENVSEMLASLASRAKQNALEDATTQDITDQLRLRRETP